MPDYLTKEGLEKIKKELEELKTVKRKEIAVRLKHAISFGDLKENAAYDEARDAQGFLEGRIMKLEKLIKGAVIIIIKEGKRDKVQIGSTVTVINNNKEEVFTIVGPVEANPMGGKISAESPLGKELLDRKKGQTFKVQTPDGKVEYKVIKIE